jgi:hypothetical protein
MGLPARYCGIDCTAPELLKLKLPTADRRAALPNGQGALHLRRELALALHGRAHLFAFLPNFLQQVLRNFLTAYINSCERMRRIRSSSRAAIVATTKVARLILECLDGQCGKGCPIEPFVERQEAEPICQCMRSNDEVRENTACASVALLPPPLRISLKASAC